MKRESGFYWIRRQGGDPEVAQWSEFMESWYRCGTELDTHDSEVDVLSDRLPPPA